MNVATRSRPARGRARCEGGDHTRELVDRETMAKRLLKTSRKHSFDPDEDVSWDASLDPDKFYLPPTAVSLYETPLWDRMNHQQRVELSKHEAASWMYQGIWFEMALMQLLLRYNYSRDLTSKHVQYALTEIADECRHSKMFGDMVAKLGTPNYGPPRYMLEVLRLFKTVALPVAGYAATLMVEEVLDTAQRVAFPDEDIQPVVREVNRIHVIEEARHVNFAREELRRTAPKMSAVEREVTRWVIAEATRLVLINLINPDCYAAVGLDPKQADRKAHV